VIHEALTEMEYLTMLALNTFSIFEDFFEALEQSDLILQNLISLLDLSYGLRQALINHYDLVILTTLLSALLINGSYQ
jgi:hypothetical protein